jgi:hypothetical protein
MKKYQKEFQSGELEIFSSYVYGNLSNKIYLLERSIDDGGIPTVFKSMSYSDFVTAKKELSRILDQIDRLHSLIPTQTDLQEMLFSLRIMIYTGRDLFNDMSTSKFKSENDYRKYLEANLMLIKVIFEDRKRFVERYYSWQQHKQLFLMVLRVIPRRLFEGIKNSLGRKKSET